MLLGIGHILLVNDEIAEEDNDDGDGAKEEISVEQALRLLVEQILVVAELVWALWWQFIPVDHVALAVKE